MQQAAPSRPGEILVGLHGLRGLAALATVVFHVAYVPQPVLTVPVILDHLVPYLGMGVYLFYVLSAFVLLHTNHGKTIDGKWLRSYVTKRFFRIAPLFYTMLMLYCSLWLWHGSPIDPLQLFTTIFFIFNFVPGHQESLVNAGWTIGVEMPFYALLPLVLLMVRNLGGALCLLILCMAVSVVTRMAITGTTGPGYASMALFSNLGVFALGIAAFYLSDRWRPTLSQTRFVGLLASVWLSAIVLGYGKSFSFTGKAELLFWSIPLALICFWQVHAPSAFLRCNAMQWSGERSFSLYLTHPLIIWLLFSNGAYAFLEHQANSILGDWTFVLQVLLTFAINLPMAEIAYRLIEVPGLRVGKSLARRFSAEGRVASWPGSYSADIRLRDPQL